MNPSEKAGTFVPARLLAWIAEGVEERRFPAAVAFADVSGFTAMSEQLASIGKEGAETLTGILNNYFTAMIQRIHAGGGFVGKFGGDAMTIFFPVIGGRKMEDAVQSAIATSCNLQIEMEPFRDIKTKAGVFSLGMKVGIGVGDVLLRVVSDGEGMRDCLLAGNPLDVAAEAEHHGKSGDVIVSLKAMSFCSITGATLEGGFHRINVVEGSKLPFQPIPEIEREEAWNEIAKDFIDPAVFNRMLLGLDSVGEIRKVSILFLAVSGLDYDEDQQVGSKLAELYRWVQRITRGYTGSINKVDMGDKGSKILITFGTPLAHENDEQLAVRCGLELVKGQDSLRGWGVTIRAGIGTGVVFAGEVGAPKRQEYTVMGRAVNLAARLMSRADKGELLLDETTYRRCEGMFEFSESELVQLKGIAEPMPVRKAIGLKTKTTESSGESKRPLVGRQREVEAIVELLDAVRAGEAHALIVRGDAGWPVHS